MNNSDTVRKLLRQAVPKSIYRLGAEIVNAIQVIRTNGFQTYVQLFHPAKNHTIKVDSVHLQNYQYPLFYRPGTPDVNTLIQNLIRKEYGQFYPKSEPQWIIDAGGYIGDASVYFLNRFSNCRVLCLEPDPENYALAVRNLQSYSNRAVVLQKGLWSFPTRLSLSGSFVGTHLVEATYENDTVEVCDVETLLRDYGIDRLDILKLDVEGAEDVILQESAQWLPKVKTLIVEFHGIDRRKKGIEFLQGQGFRHYEYRSLNYFSAV